MPLRSKRENTAYIAYFPTRAICSVCCNHYTHLEMLVKQTAQQFKNLKFWSSLGKCGNFCKTKWRKRNESWILFFAYYWQKKKKGSKAGKTQVAVFTEKASVKERKNSHNLLEVIDSRSKNNPTSIWISEKCLLKTVVRYSLYMLHGLQVFCSSWPWKVPVRLHHGFFWQNNLYTYRQHVNCYGMVKRLCSCH